MACGTPVIASQVGGLAYLVQDSKTGYTIPDNDPDILCDKLSGLLGNPELHSEMGLRAAEYAQDYSWEKIAAQILKVYEGLVEGRREPAAT
jgi:D-inositol-3-phosphate glycosyltransferase